MATWRDITSQITETGAKNVTVRGDSLVGNDGTVLTRNPSIAVGYVETDWDAVNCRAAR